MFYVVTIEIKGKKREDIKRKSLERHIIIYQDMIIGGSFLPALPITTTTKRGKKNYFDISKTSRKYPHSCNKYL